MGVKRYSRHITRTRRWHALRMAVLERDGWACVQCGARGRLEVDHVLPVRTNPELAHDPGNLQALCSRCHSRKTRIECGLGRPDPARDAWRDLLHDMQRNPSSREERNA